MTTGRDDKAGESSISSWQSINNAQTVFEITQQVSNVQTSPEVISTALHMSLPASIVLTCHWSGVCYLLIRQSFYTSSFDRSLKDNVRQCAKISAHLDEVYKFYMRRRYISDRVISDSASMCQQTHPCLTWQLLLVSLGNYFSLTESYQK